MKEGSIMKPSFYLGAKLNKSVLPNVDVAWKMSSSKYVQATIQNVQYYLASTGERKLLKNAFAPFTGNTSLSCIIVLS
jgi:hypothetical protein